MLFKILLLYFFLNINSIKFLDWTEYMCIWNSFSVFFFYKSIADSKTVPCA